MLPSNRLICNHDTVVRKAAKILADGVCTTVDADTASCLSMPSTPPGKLYGTPNRRKGRKPRSSLPRIGWLFKVVALSVGALLALHALSCGAFYKFRLPQVLELPREVYDDIRDIYILAGTNKRQGSPRLIRSNSPCNFHT